MTFKPVLRLLSAEQLQQIDSTSIRILERIGLKVYSDETLGLLEGREGISVERQNGLVTFREETVRKALSQTPRSFSIYGRGETDAYRVTFGQGDLVVQSVLGEFKWVDSIKVSRRDGRLEDLDRAAAVADALPHLNIIGAMIQPAEVPVEVQDIHIFAELLKRSRKPVRAFVHDRNSARYILEMLAVVAGSTAQLRERPLTMADLEPISPLMLAPEGLEATIELARGGIPVVISPMPQAMATGPVTLIGNVAQGNAEILGALTIIQTIVPGTSVVYYNATHIMDPRIMTLVFGGPEQGLMSLAATELAKSYNMPVGVNVGLTDAKLPDAQAGLEKGMTALIGALAGADLFGGMGIAGVDQGFNLAQLVIDDEMIGYIKRILQGLRVDEEALAYEVVERVGVGRNFLTDDHTLAHCQDELWIPSLCDRSNWDQWSEEGHKTMLNRAVDVQEQILREHSLEWLAEDKRRELDAIVAAAEREILLH